MNNTDSKSNKTKCLSNQVPEYPCPKFLYNNPLFNISLKINSATKTEKFKNKIKLLATLKLDEIKSVFIDDQGL